MLFIQINVLKESGYRYRLNPYRISDVYLYRQGGASARAQTKTWLFLYTRFRDSANVMQKRSVI